MKKIAICLAALAMLSLSACGGGDDKSDKASDPLGVGDLPACKTVWKVGETLDLAKYEGCNDGDTVVAVVTKGCYDADSNYLGQLATYEDKLWVIQTGTDPQTGEGGTAGTITDVNPNC